MKLNEVAVPDKIQELSRMEGLRGCTIGCHMAQPGVARISPGDLDLQAKGGSGRVAALNRSPFMGPLGTGRGVFATRTSDFACTRLQTLL